MFLCQLTGTVVKNPVVTKDGHIYEKSALLRYLKEHDSTDPANTTNKLNPETDLIEIRENGLINKPSSAFSLGDITSLMSMLQDKINDMMIELQDVKKERDEARHQVTHLLYLRDSATQIISKHIAENELLKSQINDLKKRAHTEEPTASTGARKQARTSANAAENVIAAGAVALMENRKQRKILSRPPDAYEQYKKFTYTSNLAHVRCMKNVLSRSFSGRRIPGIVAVGAGSTISLQLLPAEEDNANTKQLTELLGHDDAVTCLESLFYPSADDLESVVLGLHGSTSSSSSPFQSCLNLFSGSLDGTVRHWKDPFLSQLDELDWLDEDHHLNASEPNINTLITQYIYKPEVGHITSLKRHPVGTLLGVTGQANFAVIYDLLTNSEFTKLSLGSGYADTEQVRQLTYQPDGNLALGALASSNHIPIWDIREKTIEAQLSLPARPTSISASQNGYHIAVVTDDSSLHIWDLRKLEPIGTPVAFNDQTILQCQFDQSGKNISVLTDTQLSLVRGITKKQYQIINTWSHNGAVHTSFDQLTDDYILQVANDGLFTSYNAF